MERYYPIFKGLGYGLNDFTVTWLPNYCTDISDLTLNLNWLEANTAAELCNGLSSLVNCNMNFSMGTQSDFSFAHAFWSCSNLRNLDVSQWNMNNVINLESTFSGCGALENFNAINWNTSHVLNLSNIFSYCYSLTNIDISNWDVRNVYTANDMFYFCSQISTLNLPNWNFCHLSYLTGMFHGCSALTSLNLSNWNLCNIEFMNGVFAQCSNLTDIYFNNCNLNNLMISNQCFSGVPSGCNIWVPTWKVKKIFLNDISTQSFTNIKSIYNLDWDMIYNYTIMNTKTWFLNIQYDGLLVDDHFNNFSVNITPLQGSIYTANPSLDKTNRCISIAMTGVEDNGSENMTVTLEDDDNNKISQDIQINAMSSSIKGEYTVTKPSVATYGFVYNEDSTYYEAENIKKSYTYAKAVIKFKTYTGKLILKCINESGSVSSIYGVVSNIDCNLINDYYSTDAAANVKRSFKGSTSSSTPVSLVYDNLEENKEYTIEVKFIWYASTSYTGAFKFQVEFEQ